MSLLRPRVLEEREIVRSSLDDEGSRAAKRTRPHVILYVVDTLRSDRLGVYGHHASVSPEIDRFAAESVTFEAAVAQAPWTLPAMASIFTGLDPRTHRTNTKESRLPAELMTMAELLAEAGYATGAIVANGFVSEAFGFDRGFEEFQFFPSLETRAEQLLGAASEWLDSVGSRRPIFLFVHSIDPHDSYDPPASFRPSVLAGFEEPGVGTREAMKRLKESREDPAPGLIETLMSLYDGEVAYADWAFGRFLDDLRRRGLYQESLIVFVSDHGEEFFDHGGWLHGHSLHAELVNVPLIVRFPDGLEAGSRIAAPVQQIDLLPTLAEYLDLGVLEALQGRSLLRHVERELPRGSEQAFSYLDNRWISLVRGRFKLIARPAGGGLRGVALFDRIEDSGEKRDLSAERPVLAGFMGSKVIEQLLERRREVTSARAEIDPEMAEHLRALGYLD